MLSLEIIRKETERVRQGLNAKGDDNNLNLILSLDKEHRSLINQINELRAKRNRVSSEIAVLKKQKSDAAPAISAMRRVGESIKDLEGQAADEKERLDGVLFRIPNLPHDSVPIGTNETQNVIIREWGTEQSFDFEPQDHLNLGEKLGLFDFQRGAKIAGAGFPLYTGIGATLERSLINFMLDYHLEHHGYTELFPPFLVCSESALTCGQLPKFAEDMYRSEKDDLWLIPTAEVPVTNIYRDEILEEEVLPKCFAAYSACFRREAGSYGKDTRGFLRLHQFNKVELVKFVEPKSSYDELETLVKNAEAILQALGLRYRVLELCTGDLSFAAAKCYDLEVWAPGEKKWLEVSSCSNFEDFQARRGNIRYRRANDKKVDFIHTLNGSGVATPRLLVALLETYQTKDGKVRIPGPLQSYLGREVLG